MSNIDSDKCTYKKQYEFYNFFFLCVLLFNGDHFEIQFQKFFFYTSKIVEITEDILP